MLHVFVLRAVTGASLLFLAPSKPILAQAASTNGVIRVRAMVATHDLRRGDTLGVNDMALVDTTMVWRWSTAPDTTRAEVGWVTRRTIMAGEVLRAPAVALPPLISVGSTVSIIYQDGPVRIQLAGVATNSASLGAPVGVRIDSSRRLDGIAVAPHTVRLR